MLRESMVMYRSFLGQAESKNPKNGGLEMEGP